MNMLIRALADAAAGGPADYYAWIITRDHLADETMDEAGTTGPSAARPDLLARVEAGEGHTFRMYDDDGELYYTGRLVRDTEDDRYDEETALGGPLDDFGTPNAGAVRIEYHGHPEWSI